MLGLSYGVLKVAKSHHDGSTKSLEVAAPSREKKCRQKLSNAAGFGVLDALELEFDDCNVGS